MSKKLFYSIGIAVLLAATAAVVIVSSEENNTPSPVQTLDQGMHIVP
jgi:hypothetical protein